MTSTDFNSLGAASSSPETRRITGEDVQVSLSPSNNLNDRLLNNQNNGSNDTPQNIVSQTSLPENDENETQKSVLKTWYFWRLGLYLMSVAFTQQFVNLLAPVIGANYFSSSHKDCSDNNAKYALWNGVFSSIGGLIGFLLNGYMGHLSDIYGRKKFMFLSWLALTVPFIPLAITDNIWYYLYLSPIYALSGSYIGMPVVTQIALADVIPKKQRSKIYGILFGLAGVILIFASGAVAGLRYLVGIKLTVGFFLLCQVLALFWLLFVVPETHPNMSKDGSINEITVSHESISPLQVFRNIKTNDLIYYMSIIALVTSLPEAGIQDILANYSFDVLHMCKEGNSTTFLTVATVVLGIGLLFSQFILIPLVIKYTNNNQIFQLFIGIVILIVFLAFGIILYILSYKLIGYLFWLLYSLTFILSPLSSGILSEHLSKDIQGIGIGSLHSVKGITFCFAPFMFGGLYDLLNNSGFLKTIPFMVGIVISIASLPVLFGPLRITLNKYISKEIEQEKLENKESV